MPPTESLIFGKNFTDHMLMARWTLNGGWEAPEIRPYGPLHLDPSATVLHYSSTLFEGMKAYKDRNGVARLFRPDMNMKRLNKSAARLAFPTVDEEVLIELIKQLVAVDDEWIPTAPGCSLCTALQICRCLIRAHVLLADIRPTMIGTRASLGVGPSDEMLLFVICSPVGPYFAAGFKPVSLLASTKDVRAWPGGTGAHKLGSNYAGGVVPQLEAAKEGYQQILWLFGPEHELTEVGTMNLFAVIQLDDDTVELCTPPLDGMILPGVTRDSVLSLCKSHANPLSSHRIAGLPANLVISERKIYMKEIVERSANGSLLEMFGTGTAAIVCAIERIGYEGADVTVPCGSSGLGSIAATVLREIEGRQLGEIESDWSVVV
ncbi:branched-chain amino acid aminotransferase, partial [Phenoliferia sp. Uapishka_3]